MSIIFASLLNETQWNPDFSNLQGERKLFQEIGEFEKSEVKLQCLTEERNLACNPDELETQSRGSVNRLDNAFFSLIGCSSRRDLHFCL